MKLVRSYFQNFSIGKLVFLYALFSSIFLNFNFSERLINWIVSNNLSYLYLIQTLILVFLFNLLIATIFVFNRAAKFLITIFLLIAVLSSYFIDTYSVVINEQMLLNVLETNLSETKDLISLSFFSYLFFFFLFPVFLLKKIDISFNSWISRKKQQAMLFLSSLLAIILILYFSSSFYMPYFREQKESINYFANPINTFSAFVNLVRHMEIFSPNIEHKVIGLDATINRIGKNKIHIMIVGETARADHFSLNGYTKNTNPLLSKKENLISYPNVESCGTLTRISVPCMFSIENREQFDVSSSKHQDNVIDILKRSGVYVLWKDNNSSSKDVANRVDYLSIKDSCNGECRDVELIKDLDQLIDDKKNSDILIVLHPMGSHGPAYFKRVPESFKKFLPECRTNQFNECKNQEVENAYDNTILYTDYFINSSIDFLSQYKDRFDVSLLYISDHGESLGEKGVYLHGLPYYFAPKAQKHVPMIYWSPSINKEKFNIIKKKSKMQLSHDFIFHSLLGIFDVKTKIYNGKFDFLK